MEFMCILYAQGQEEDFFEAKLYTTAPGKEPEEIATLGSLNYNKDSKRLVLVNRNTQLETKILLLGYSDKRTHHDIIGQFGRLRNDIHITYTCVIAQVRD